MNVADVGIAIRSAALAYGLEFIPLVSEKFDLAFAEEGMKEPQMERLIDTVNSRSFRRELESMGGYETRQTGEMEAVSVGKDPL
jgi:molybdate-binding protein